MQDNTKHTIESAGSVGGQCQPLLVSASSLAEMLQISKRTLWRLLSAGQLPLPVRVGGSVRWRVHEVRKWIDSGCPEHHATKQ